MNQEERIAFWRSLLADYEQSGLTVKEWCRRNQQCSTSFYRWRRYLQALDHGAPAGFVRVEGGESLGKSSDFPVLLPNGLTIQVPPSFDEDVLRRLLSVLSSS